MFDPIEEEPRGFSGRPLAALLFAVGTGCSASYVSSWIGSELAGCIFVAIMVLVPVYLWYRDDQAEATGTRD
jgi:Flp pilus assembly protein TadB